jgi:hypothetical protein
MTFINVHPSEPIQLTSDLNLTELISFFYDIDSTLSGQALVITFNMMGINGIDLVSWQMLSVQTFTDLKLAIKFEQSNIDFYRNGTELTGTECSADMISKHGYKTTTLFNILADLTFARQNTYPEHPICAFIFSEAEFNSLSIYSLINSILVRNLWRFESLDSNNQTSMNASVRALYLGGYGYDLDTGLIQPLVFESVQWLFIYRSVGSIQADLFKHFGQINYVALRLDSLTNFVHKIGFAWTTSLPETSQSWIELSNYVGSFSNWIDGSGYSYPDEDFCRFAQYPQRNFLIYILNTKWANLSQCTHTIRYLLSNYFTQNMREVFTDFPNSEVIFSICKNTSNETVDFEPMVSNCNMSSSRGSDSTHAEYYQVAYIFEFVEDLLVFIAVPCACALGLFLNVLVIRAVHQNQEKDLKDDFYQYMSLNSKFNCLYCIIFLFYPVNSCVDTLTGNYFCSSIRASYATQLYKIVLVAFFGETFKMCSNIMYILMNVNRYMLIGREHNPTFENISKWDINRVIAATVFISLLANVAHAFQYELHGGDLYTFYSSNYVYVYPSYPAVEFSSTALDVYLIFYFMINFLVFVVVNTSVEVVLVRKLHTELADKKARLKKMAAHSRKSSAPESLSFRKKRKLDMEERTEQRAIIMVVINALLNFFLRLPELFVIFSLSYDPFGFTFLETLIEAFPNTRTFVTDLTYFFYTFLLSRPTFLYTILEVGRLEILVY